MNAQIVPFSEGVRQLGQETTGSSSACTGRLACRCHGHCATVTDGTLTASAASGKHTQLTGSIWLALSDSEACLTQLPPVGHNFPEHLAATFQVQDLDLVSPQVPCRELADQDTSKLASQNNP